MKKKLFKYIKFFICMAIIFSLVAPSYASLSASDGSAFVTKAEFDSALADFNSRLTTFEAGINSKIDSQVTSYLDRNGIWSGKDQVLYAKTSNTKININGNIKFASPCVTLVTNQASPCYLTCLANMTPNKSGLFYLNLKTNNENYGGNSFPVVMGIDQNYVDGKDWTVDEVWSLSSSSHMTYGGAIFLVLVNKQLKFGQRLNYDTMSVPMQTTLADFGGRVNSTTYMYPLGKIDTNSPQTLIKDTITKVTTKPTSFDEAWLSGYGQMGFHFTGGYSSAGKRYCLTGFVSKDEKYYLDIVVSYSANVSTSSDKWVWLYQLSHANQLQGFSLESAIIY